MIVFLMIHVDMVIAVARREVLVVLGGRGRGLGEEDFSSPLSSAGEGWSG